MLFWNKLEQRGREDKERVQKKKEKASLSREMKKGLQKSKTHLVKTINPRYVLSETWVELMNKQNLGFPKSREFAPIK